MKVLLLSAYAAHSHVHWERCLYAMFPHWQWQSLHLPPRHFSWRVRGNPLIWSVTERAVLEQQYDLLLATSMVDLATLRGLVPALSRVHSLYYFHENQFAYPQQGQQQSLLEAQMVSLYGALAADGLLFNSAYNCTTFMAGCEALLAKLPDYVPAGVVASLQEKASVLPVPVDWVDVEGDQPAERLLAAGPRPLLLSWLGRFEHDKGGDGLLQILLQLEELGIDYQLTVTGQQFRQSPAVFEHIRTAYSHRLVQFGYVETPADYRALLRRSDMVLSTALHEFQGLAVLQAVACGCVPVVPDRLAYPEYFSARYRYHSSPGEPHREARAAAELIVSLAPELLRGRVEIPDVAAYCRQSLKPRYAHALQRYSGHHDSQ